MNKLKLISGIIILACSAGLLFFIVFMTATEGMPSGSPDVLLFFVVISILILNVVFVLLAMFSSKTISEIQRIKRENKLLRLQIEHEKLKTDYDKMKADNAVEKA